MTVGQFEISSMGLSPVVCAGCLAENGQVRIFRRTNAGAASTGTHGACIIRYEPWIYICEAYKTSKKLVAGDFH